MEFVNWGILLLLVLVVPFILGLIPVKYMNGLQRTPAMAYACGWFVSFFLFEVVALPFILMEKSFSIVVSLYTTILLIMSMVSICIGKDVLYELVHSIKDILKMPLNEKLCWLAVFVIVGWQMMHAILFEYWDGDDAYYIATAVMTDTFDSMYLRDAYTGYIYPLDVRHAFSPTPVYQAWLSRISGIAPAQVAHFVIAPVWLVLMYCIYSQIANKLFSTTNNVKGNNSIYRPLFMILIAIWFMYGNVSLYTAETFAMTRTWQGKGLMAGIILPALILCIMYIIDDNVSKGMWLMCVSVVVSAAFATSISFMVIPTIFGLVALIVGVRDRNIIKMAKIFVCCVPCLALGMLYLTMS